MHLIVQHKSGPREKKFTMGTLQIAFVAVNPHVFVEVALLSERLAASEDRAHKGLLLGVRTQVVEKIMPFLEASAAGFELTQENLCPSLALWLEVFNIFECAQIRNVEALFEGCKIHILTFLVKHLRIVGDPDSMHNSLSHVCGKRIINWDLLLHIFGGMPFFDGH